MIISVLSFFLVFTVVAMAHELGHFFVSRRSGIRVLELGIGFGPNLWRTKRNNTAYSINLIPVLAFVRLAGIDEQSEDEKDVPDSEKYHAARPLGKFLSISSGPIANLILGAMIFSVLAGVAGLPEVKNVVDGTMKGYPAAKAGIQPGDKLTGIDGFMTKDMSYIVTMISKSRDKEITLNVQRQGKDIKIKATPVYDEKAKKSILGFTFRTEQVKHGFLGSIKAGIEKTAALSWIVIVIFFQLLAGKVSVTDLAGPIGIAQFSGQAAMQGWETLLYFTGFISVNLGILNLLPIPALDGGRLVFVMIEWVRGKAINIELENKFHQWGLIALLGLMFVVSINDIYRIISARFIK